MKVIEKEIDGSWYNVIVLRVSKMVYRQVHDIEDDGGTKMIGLNDYDDEDFPIERYSVRINKYIKNAKNMGAELLLFKEAK